MKLDDLGPWLTLVQALLVVASIPLTVWVNRRLLKSQATQADNTGAAALTEGVKNVVVPLNARIDELEARDKRRQQEMETLGRLSDTQSEEIITLNDQMAGAEKTITELTNQNKVQAAQMAGQAAQLDNQTAENKDLRQQLAEVKNEARGLRLGVSVLINQLERLRIVPEYHPNTAALPAPDSVPVQVEVVGGPVPVTIDQQPAKGKP